MVFFIYLEVEVFAKMLACTKSVAANLINNNDLTKVTFVKIDKIK